MSGLIWRNQNLNRFVGGFFLNGASSMQVETMHDFEAANSDELELKRGEVVLVVPTASLEDQVRSFIRPCQAAWFIICPVCFHFRVTFIS